ncbi:hypothetical protein LTR53_002872 [Teratosphaeriaceae sp. CCFEE 6253]|nr:hypothetical protein LTR53_002872 [Teratosphaeriaceae sp. CCFEE 6253]
MLPTPTNGAELLEDLHEWPPARASARQMAAASIAASIVKGPSLVAEFEGTRSSTRGLTQLRELPPTATLLLYTPVLLPSGHVSEPDSPPDDDDPVDAKPAPPSSQRPPPTTTDPFEMLGRALSKHHRRVRHVPYVPRVGFTPTHAAFLAKAHAVIVVTCEPAACADMETTLAKQAEFVGAVAAVAAALEGDAEGRKVAVPVPVVNFSFGGDEWENQVATYNHVWVGEEYNGDSVMNIIKLVFG